MIITLLLEHLLYLTTDQLVKLSSWHPISCSIKILKDHFSLAQCNKRQQQLNAVYVYNVIMFHSTIYAYH